ncbi:MAG: formate dehydrogenase subunit delta [Gemmatimonadota bacterium]
MNRVDNLVRMANQIAAFYQSMHDREEGLQGTFSHIRRSWPPGMRTALLDHIDHHGAEGLDPFVLEAITANRVEFTPRASATPRP